MHTLNSEIFARGLFSRNFADAKFRDNKPSQNGGNTLLFTGLGKSCPSRTGPRSAVGNVSAYRCVSDCRSRGREFDPGPVPCFRGD